MKHVKITVILPKTIKWSVVGKITTKIWGKKYRKKSEILYLIGSLEVHEFNVYLTPRLVASYDMPKIQRTYSVPGPSRECCIEFTVMSQCRIMAPAA